MLFATWFFVTLALAGAPLDADKVCASSDPVALGTSLYKSLGRRPGPSCPGLVGPQAVADYLKAFAVLSRELQQPEVADQLVRQVAARWLLLPDGRNYLLYDAKAAAFVDPSPFLRGTPGPEMSPAEVAYQHAYRDLRAKRHEQARLRLQQCLSLDPDHARCHWEMGWVHWVAEEWDAVVASWEQVERIDPEHPELGTWLPQARERSSRAATPDGPSPAEPDTHCGADEVVGFSCTLGDRVLSLCWDDQTSLKLAYRFGPPGAPDLTWPRTAGPAWEDVFSFETDVLAAPPGGQVRPRLENSALSFVVDGHRYTVFEETHDFVPQEQGLKVLVGGLQEVTLKCTDASSATLADMPR